MSLSAEPVKTFLVDDPRIDFDREAHYLVERSGGDVTYRTWKAISASKAAITFNTLVPSRDTAVCSKIYVKIPITVTVTGNALAGAAAGSIKSFLALRFAPFTSCCNSIQLELNGKQQSTNIYRYYPALMKFCNAQTEMTNDFSCMPTFMDTYPSYYNPTSAAGRWGSIRDPLMGYGDTSSIYEPSKRQGYLYNIVHDESLPVDSPTSYKFSFELEEIIPLSPLFWGHREVKSLIGLDTLNVSFQIRDLSRMFSSCRFGTNPGDNLTFAFEEASLVSSVLEFIYIKPRANVPIPRMLHYPYNNVKDFSIVSKSLTKGVVDRNKATSEQFSNIQLQGVPKRLYIFVKRQESDETYYTTDTYARIDKITLDLGTRSGLLGEASPEALYRMAVKNGYQGSWDAWYNQIGSVLCIDFGSDVSLDLLDAPGALKQMQLSFKLDYTTLYNNAASSIVPNSPELPVTYTMYMIVVYDGMMIVKDGEVLFESNDVSALDVADSSKVRKLSYDDIADYVYGGVFTGGSLSKFVSKVKTGLVKAKDFTQQKIIPGVQKALPYIEKGAKVAAEVLPALAALGYTEEEIFDIVNGRGGKVMPKKSIKARAARK